MRIDLASRAPDGKRLAYPLNSAPRCLELYELRTDRLCAHNPKREERKKNYVSDISLQTQK